MHELHLKLILIYLHDYEDQYELHEIKKLCNLTTNQLITSLNILKSKGYIKYDSINLKLLDKGINFLKSKKLYNVKIDELFESTVTLRINEKKLEPEDIYIPENFKY